MRKLPKKQKVFSKLFIFILLVLPFITWRGYYEGPKVFVFDILGFLLTVFWLYRIVRQKELLKITKVDLFYLGWLGVLLISSLFGIHPLESVVGGSYRHQGVIFFLTLWLVYKTVNLLKKPDRQLLNKSMAFAVLAEAVVVFLQYGLGHLYFGKPLGTIGEANAVAGFLAMGSYFVFQNADSIYFAIPIISILMAESRSGILALLPNILFVLKNLNSRIRMLLTILIVSAAVLIPVLISMTRSVSDVEDRQVIWRLGFNQIVQRPALGFGAESGEAVYDAAYRKNVFALEGIIVDRAHNLVLDVVMWSGLIGLVFFVGFLTAFYKNLGDKYKKLAFISFIIYSMFQPLSVVHWLLPFLL